MVDKFFINRLMKRKVGTLIDAKDSFQRVSISWEESERIWKGFIYLGICV